MARCKPDGNLDFAIDGGGVVIWKFSGSSVEVANGAAIQTAGKSVVAGRNSNDGVNNDFALVRY